MIAAVILLVILAGGISTVIWASTHSRARLWGPVVWRGPIDGETKKIALTFDDGPTPGSTEDVLDALDAAGVKATFFVIGRNVEKHPALLKRIHESGHLIANHTFDHSHYMYLRNAAYWREQIEETNRAIEQIIPQRPLFFRSPMGVRTWRANAPLRDTNQIFVTWSRRGLDGLLTSADQICNRLIPNMNPGDIIVLHDGIEPGYPRNPRATVEAIPRIIAALRQRGIDPVRLDELLKVKPHATMARTISSST